MTRFIMPIILIGIAVTIFFTFTNPIYSGLSGLQAQVGSYNDALNNSKALESQRNALTAKYNAIDPNNLAKLQKLLPDNVDNVRLILEIQQIASPYGMTLTNVKYDATDQTTAAGAATSVQGGTAKATSKDYGVFDLEFSTSATYNDFINFTKDLESNLRIVDISSISFTSDTANIGVGVQKNSVEVYKYDFHIKTYWLKN